MTQPLLFSPFGIRDLALKNRIAVAPYASIFSRRRISDQLAAGQCGPICGLAPRATSDRNGGRDHLRILGEIKSEHPGEIVGINTARVFATSTPSLMPTTVPMWSQQLGVSKLFLSQTRWGGVTNLVYSASASTRTELQF